MFEENRGRGAPRFHDNYHGRGGFFRGGRGGGPPFGQFNHRPRYEEFYPPPPRFQQPPPSFEEPYSSRYELDEKTSNELSPRFDSRDKEQPQEQYQEGIQPPPSGQQVRGNDIEIIVVHRDQWPYAEHIEKKLRSETPIKFIDLLFLHSPNHISITLNDLFERRTLYAIVVAPVNEENQTMTLHILHNQTEHRSIPLADAIPLIMKDFMKFNSKSETSQEEGGKRRARERSPIERGQFPPEEKPSGRIRPHDRSPIERETFPPDEKPSGKIRPQERSAERDQFPSDSNSAVTVLPPAFAEDSRSSETFPSNLFSKEEPKRVEPVSATQSSSAAFVGKKKLPEEIHYLLRTIIAEEGVQFLSPPQIDTLIDYLQTERSKLVNQGEKNPPMSSGGYKTSSTTATPVPPIPTSNPLNGNPPLAPSLASSLLDNPQVKAALNSLIKIGALNTNSTSSAHPIPNESSSYERSIYPTVSTTTSSYMDGYDSMNSYSSSSNTSYVAPNTSYGVSNTWNSSRSQIPASQSESINTQVRRHPLSGIEVQSIASQSQERNFYSSQNRSGFQPRYR